MTRTADEVTNVKGAELAHRISVAMTTYATQSYYTHACLEAIREWKNSQHELIVACHDPSLLLEFYLKACARDGLIDKLIWTPSGYGHTKGVNRCFQEARGEFLFHIANDILIGPAIVNDCASKLTDPQLGLIGWHWHNEGTFWQDGSIVDYQVRNADSPNLSETDAGNIRNARWFTGKTFEAIGPKWLCLCNTAFFGIRKDLWNQLGGFSDVYKHYWADDFLNYAVLDQGLDIRHFEHKFRKREYFAEFQYDNVDVEDRRRDEDSIALSSALADYTRNLEGGLSEKERQLLYQIARSLGPGQTILHVGVWRGAGLCLFLSALKNRPATFIGIDCFDDAEIARLSGQPPVSREECLRYIEPFLTRDHVLTLMKNNTLAMREFPAADVVFVDAGHTKACIEHDVRLAKNAVKKNGILIFHDYGQDFWPDIKHVLDANFKKEELRLFDTLAVVQMNSSECAGSLS